MARQTIFSDNFRIILAFKINQYVWKKGFPQKKNWGGGALNNGENASKLTMPKFTYPFAIKNHFLYNYFDK